MRGIFATAAFRPILRGFWRFPVLRAVFAGVNSGGQTVETKHGLQIIPFWWGLLLHRKAEGASAWTNKLKNREITNYKELLKSIKDNEIRSNIDKFRKPNSILFKPLRRFIQVAGYRPEEAVGFHPIGINGLPLVRSSKTCGTLQDWLRPTTVGRKTMMKFLNNLKSNKSGASAAEYALIVAVLGGFVVLGATQFGTSLQTALTTSGTELESQATTGAAN